MAVARKKISKSGYILIAIAVVAVIALPILHIVGIINLSFIVDGIMGLMMWGSANAINAAIIIGASFALGAFTFYMLKGYIIGEKQYTNPILQSSAAAYVPRGDIPAAASTPKEEVTVS